MLELTTDELLSTTRSVRRRLDLSRPVEREVLTDCLRLAQQAPTASYAESAQFVVVMDAARRAELAALWRRSADAYIQQGAPGAPAMRASRLLDSVRHLAEHLHEVPVHVVPCVEGRTDGQPAPAQAGRWASVVPAAWSFMLAARARGLGSVWTTFHLSAEREAAELLGIPYDRVMQAGLLPVAYTIGTDFKPAPRKPLDSFAHWDCW